jgi:GWxTD domain-containing protein
MLAVRWAALAAIAVVVQAQQRPALPESPLVLRAVRSYRAEQQRTEVTAFLQVPYMILEPSSEGGGGRMSYRVAVKVTDSTGLTLLQQAWQNHADEALRQPSAFGVETVRFSLAPGRYTLEVGVEDSVSGRHVTSTVPIEGFSSTPPASDLLLSPKIRPVTAEDTVPQPAELRWGRMLVTAAARLELTPLRPTVFYLLEAYSPEQSEGTLVLKVVDSAGKVLTTTPATKVQLPAGGGVLKGQLDLTGLPAGWYTMTAALALAGAAVERSAIFTMAGLDQTLETAVARKEAAKTTDAGYFETLSEAELDAAEAPLTLIAKSGELSPYKGLSVRAKRRFLSEFWAKLDPTPGPEANEARQKFYEGIAFAQKNYGEKGQNPRPGWKTDRGRVYVRNGTPEEVLQRPQAGRSPPYEVWHFTRGKNRYYVFVDRSNGLGFYQLVTSNDVRETSLPNWMELLHKEDAVLDISRFVGVDLLRRTDLQDRSP